MHILQSTLKYNHKNGTSFLICHLKNTKYSLYLKNNVKQQTLQFPNKFSQEKSCQDLADMIVLHGYPFRIVEHQGFLKFVNNLQPNFRVMSEKTIHEDCKNIVANLELKVHKMICEAPGNLCFMTDMWRSNQNTGYIVITCIYIYSLIHFLFYFFI